MKQTSLLFALLLSALAGLSGCEDPDESPTKYSAGSVRWGTQCEPFTPVPQGRFSPGDTPCLELILEGYYTRGHLTSRWFLRDHELGRSRIDFSPTGALGQRMERDAAESRVTFQLHHEGQPLPPSDAYRVVLERGDGTEVARYPFRVEPR